MERFYKIMPCSAIFSPKGTPDYHGCSAGSLCEPPPGV